MRPRGFVLINALVLVAALAAVAVLLLSRAEGGRVRLASVNAAAQVTLHLDAVEAMARSLLGSSAGPDHLASAWTRRYDLPLEAGQISGEIRDLQGLFNVNWLNDSGNLPARAAFARLLTRLGVDAASGQAITAFIAPGGPEDRAAFRALDPPQDPVGGSLLMIRQIQALPGLSEAARSRLLPHLTALPGDSRLNPNTATAEVLAAFLPELGRAGSTGCCRAAAARLSPMRRAFCRRSGWTARRRRAPPQQRPRRRPPGSPKTGSRSGRSGSSCAPPPAWARPPPGAAR